MSGGVTSENGLGTTAGTLRRDLDRPSVRTYLVASVLLWGVLPTLCLNATGPSSIGNVIAMLLGGVLGSSLLAVVTLLIRPTTAVGCVLLGVAGPFLGASLHGFAWACLGVAGGDDPFRPVGLGQALQVAVIAPLFTAPVLACVTPLTIATLFWFRWAVGGGKSGLDAPPPGDG